MWPTRNVTVMLNSRRKSRELPLSLKIDSIIWSSFSFLWEEITNHLQVIVHDLYSGVNRITKTN